MKGRFLIEDFVESYINSVFEIAKNSHSLFDYENRIYENVSSKTGLNKDEIRYLSNPIHWELFCNYDDSVLKIEHLNLSSINKEMTCFLKDLEIKNRKINDVYYGNSILEETIAFSNLSMKNTRVCLNDFERSVYGIRDSILEKNNKYFEARLKILGID